MNHLGLWVLAVTGVILLAEVIAGRHRKIYSRSDWLVNGICMLGAAVVRPAGTAAVGGTSGFSWSQSIGISFMTLVNRTSVSGLNVNTL